MSPKCGFLHLLSFPNLSEFCLPSGFSQHSLTWIFKVLNDLALICIPERTQLITAHMLYIAAVPLHCKGSDFPPPCFLFLLCVCVCVCVCVWWHGTWDLTNSSRPGIEPVPHVLEGWSLNLWIAWEVPAIHFYSYAFIIMLSKLRISFFIISYQISSMSN